jgi:flagellar assembly protein FliH
MSMSPESSAAAVRVRAGSAGTTAPFPYDSVSSPFVGAGGFSATEAATIATSETQARLQGKQEGQAEAHKVFEEKLDRERSVIAAALSQFTRDRAAYFATIEGEVVQLALAIAGNILHREAQLDPLLLAGIVRVALEKIDGATGVTLRLHPRNTEDWRRFLATHLEPADLPEFVEDASLPPDQCQLETSMGTARLGLELQLKEIEQGLMDLLAARPGEKP